MTNFLVAVCPSRRPMFRLATKPIFILVAVMVLVLAGCSGDKVAAPASVSAESATAKTQDGPNKFMAYEHSIQVAVPESQVTNVYEAVEQACLQARVEQCVVMGSQLSTGNEASAEINIRAKSAGIQKLLAVLARKGHVVSQSVSSEDLASPITDAAKKMAMLSDYRSKLEGLRGHSGIDIDALIKVSKELVQVQSEIESLAGEQAHLLLRVETEILRVSIHSAESQSFLRPVSAALSNFMHNLSEGLSDAITGVAYLMPWSLVILLCFWLFRKFWLRKKS
jgi:flagellar biosynthesis chaperone FliJ